MSTRSTHSSFVLYNARVVLPDAIVDTPVTVLHGLIERVGGASGAADLQIDCEGDYVLPGLIELHTDNLERHLSPRPGTSWNAERAMLAHDGELAAAGITTAYDAITLGNDVTSDAGWTYLDQLLAGPLTRESALLRADHLLHFRCELSSPTMAEQLREADARQMPQILSLMDHTPGQGQWSDLERFRVYYAGRYGLSRDSLDTLVERRRETRSRFAASNRAAALELARRRGCVLTSHDDSSEAETARSRADGCVIAEFPTSLPAARAARECGMQVVAGAPNLVRGRSHSGNVAAADLVGAGLCDILSSDYYPASLLQAAFRLHSHFSMPLPAAIATVTATPARAAGLTDRGRICERLRADLLRVRDTQVGPAVITAWCAGRQIA